MTRNPRTNPIYFTYNNKYPNAYKKMWYDAISLVYLLAEITLLFFVIQASQAIVFAKFIETQRYRNEAYKMQQRLAQSSSILDEMLCQQFSNTEQLQLARWSLMPAYDALVCGNYYM